jgi:ankyrin repeat protein
MRAVAPIPPLLSLASGAVGAAAALLPPPYGALALALAVVLCAHAASGSFRPGAPDGAEWAFRLALTALLLLPFWPALGLSAGLIAAAPEPRALLWLSVLHALLLGWSWGLAPLLLAERPRATADASAPPRARPWWRDVAWFDPGAGLVSGLVFFGLGFLWAGLLSGRIPSQPLLAVALAVALPAAAWWLAWQWAVRGRCPSEAAPSPEHEMHSAAGAVPERGVRLERELYEAARQGRVDEALALLEAGADPRALPEPDESDQRSLMQIAVTLPDLRLLRTLIARGLPVGELHGGITPLIAATRDSRKGRLEAVLTLVANGAPLEAADRDRNQAVHHAARCEDPAVIAAVLDAGAPLEAPNGDGMTPLALALEAQCWATAEYLLKRGAALEPPGGCPAVVAAARGVHDDPTGLRLLIKARARIEAADRLGRRALHHAALHGHVRMVEALLAAGADPNAQDGHGATPVMEAVRAGEIRVLERLAFACPDLSLRDALGRTALFIAVSGKRPDPAVCRVLVAMGADPHEPGPEGLSPLDQARALGRWSLLRLLDPNAPLPESLEGAPEDADARGEGIDPLALLLGALESGREAVAEPLFALPLAAAELAEVALRLRSLRGFRWLCSRAGLNAETRLADGRSLSEALRRSPTASWQKLAVLPGARASLAGRGVLAELIEALAAGAALTEAGPFLIELCEAGADVFGAGASGRTPLQAALAADALKLAQAILEKGADPNAPDADGRSPLQEAVAERRGSAWLGLLLRHGADPQRRDRSGETALGLALEMGDREAVGWLQCPLWSWPGRPLREGDVIAAARLGDVEALERLARLGLPVDACDAQRASALLHAAGLGRGAAVAWLLARGADPNRIAANGASPLSAAIVGRSLPVLRLLLEGGADPERELAGGASALFVAAALGEADAARLLIGFGAKVDRCEERGRTPLMVAAEALFRASLGGEDGDGLAATIEVLLEAGADASRRSQRGDSALGLLLGSRVQPGRTALETLLLPSVRRLLSAGADPDAQDDRGVGPLHAAAIHGLARAALLLAEHGADPDRADRLGRRPADLARLLGYAELCALFDRMRARRAQQSSRPAQDQGLS